MEVLGPAGDDGDGGDAPPPEAQAPEEDARQHGHLPNELDVNDAIPVEVERVRQPIGHADEGKAGEGRGSHIHVQARAVLPAGKTKGHETADHVRVHHERDADAEALGGEAAVHDGRGDGVGLCVGDDRGDGAGEHDGENGEDPGGHHGPDLEVVGAEDIAVLSDGEGHGGEHVAPESDLDPPIEVSITGWYGIAVGGCDESGEGEEESREEETLAFVGD